MDLTADLARKVLVCVIDSNASHRDQTLGALTSFYTTLGFDDGNEAVKALHSLPPKAIILDEHVGPTGAQAVLQHLRQCPDLVHTHVVLTTTDRDSPFLQEALPIGVDACLLKPFRRSELLKTISKLVSRSVEDAWKLIEPVQRAALEKTMGTFHLISDLIEEGKPLPYGEVRESCEPLVSAVTRNDYKEILKGVRGHDNYTYGHSLRVATLLSLFGYRIGIRGEQLSTLAIGGLLHDVGKMLIPHEVLNKPGRLEGEEWNLMQSHVEKTIQFLENCPDLPPGIMTIASQHHEKLDGSGYPRGLAGDDLNELARMACIVDVFSALTDRRVYKAPMPADEAIRTMGSMTTEIDQQLLALFGDMLREAASSQSLSD